jgi:hypothetical protein
MKSFIAVVVAAVVALVVPSLASQEAFAVDKANKVVNKFFQESAVETTTLSLRGVETEAASSPLPGFIEMWDFGFDSTCTGEVDSMVAFKLNHCVALIDGGYITMTVTESENGQKFNVMTASFRDKKCTKPVGKPKTKSGMKGSCKQNMKIAVVMTPSKKLPAGQQGVGLALYHNSNACSSEHVSKSDLVVLQQRNRCVASDHADFVYNSCDSQTIYSYEFPSSRNGSCSGVAAPTYLPRSIGHCFNSGAFFSTFFCSWGETPRRVQIQSNFSMSGVDAGSLTAMDQLALVETYAAILSVDSTMVSFSGAFPTANPGETMVKMTAVVTAPNEVQAMQWYAAASTTLNASVMSGMYTQVLRGVAGPLGAGGLDVVVVTAVTVAPASFL